MNIVAETTTRALELLADMPLDAKVRLFSYPNGERTEIVHEADKPLNVADAEHVIRSVGGNYHYDVEFC